MRNQTPNFLIRLLCAVLLSTPAFADESGQLDFSNLGGKVILLDFWASWCKPCRESFPWMNQMLHKYAGDGLVIIAVNVDRKRENAERFLEQYPANFRIEFDPAGKLARRYKILGMPTSLILNKDGEVLARHQGFRAKDKTRYEAALIDKLSAADASGPVGHPATPDNR